MAATEPTSGAARGRTGRPPRTSRREIMVAARRLIDREGWEKLTIRRLAAEAGTAPTTLYHHVRDKDDLLAQLLDDYAAQMPRPELPADPRERIVTVACAIRETLAAWPWVVEVLVADTRVGQAALWMVDALLGGAAELGCTPVRAVDLYRSIWYYTAGEVLIRAARERREASPPRPAQRDERIRAVDPAELPHLAAVADRWASLTSRDTYADGVRSLVDGALRAVQADESRRGP